MRVGVVPFLYPGIGGLTRYSETVLRALYEAPAGDDEFIVLAHDPAHPLLSSLAPRPGWSVRPLCGAARSRLPALGAAARAAWRRLRRQVVAAPVGPDPWRTGRPLPDPHLPQFDAAWDRWLKSCGAELLLVLANSAMPFEATVPYVLVVHDLQHRLQPEFPEVSAGGEREWREYFFRNGIRRAVLVVVDSQVGKEDVLTCYGDCGTTPDRIHILPYRAASSPAAGAAEADAVRQKYRLPGRYLFFPAQLWPHKNHARVVQALGALKESHDLRPPLVCCGSWSGALREQTFREVEGLVGRLGLAGQVRFLGYVPDDDMAGLYAGATAVVFPTFFGPSNIPPLEAWASCRPLLTSDVRGVREQAGDAALLVDPRSVTAIAEGIRRLWADDDLRADLAARGRARLAGRTADDFSRGLRAILEAAKSRLRTG